MKLNVYKSMGQDDIHPRVLKELVDVVAEPLFIVFEKLWLLGKILEETFLNYDSSMRNKILFSVKILFTHVEVYYHGFLTVTDSTKE